MSLLRIRGLEMAYRPGEPVVCGLDLEVERRELFALIGPSGSGKTTTLRLIAGFERPAAGMIELSGERLADAGTSVAPDRRGVGFVFQEFALFPHLSVIGNVRFGLRGLAPAEADERAREALRVVEMEEHADRPPSELSGGQQQRVALARGLAPRPRLLLLDEPFGSLDATLRAAVRTRVRRILKDADVTAVFVTHDQDEALAIADRIGVMRDGHLEQVGTPAQVYRQPASPFVATFVGKTNLIPAVASGTVAQTALGRVQLLVPRDGATTISLQPEQLEMRKPTDREPFGTVTLRQFHGHDLTYEVAFPEISVHVRAGYLCPFVTGDQVRLVPREPAVSFEPLPARPPE